MARTPVDFRHTFKATGHAELRGTLLAMMARNTDRSSRPLCPGGPSVECVATFFITYPESNLNLSAEFSPSGNYIVNLEYSFAWPQSDDLRCTAEVYILKGGYRLSRGAIACANGIAQSVSFDMGTIKLSTDRSCPGVNIDLRVTGSVASLVPRENVSDAMAHLPKLSTDFMNLLDSGLFSDVSIECGDKSFKCHKAVLAGRSDVFARMLSSDFKEGQDNAVAIGEMDPEVLHSMLVYIYSGVIPSELVSAQLFRAAHLYNVSRLANDCGRVLAKTISLDSFHEIVEMAHLYDHGELFDRAIAFFRANKEALVASPKWKGISENCSLRNAIILHL